jgi:hypothetical protein
VTAVDRTLLRDLDALVEPTARGDPSSPLRWTTKSVRTLAAALQALGHQVSHTVVGELLPALGYSLQGNVKTREGRQHPDRDAQFRPRHDRQPHCLDAQPIGLARPVRTRSPSLSGRRHGHRCSNGDAPPPTPSRRI